MQDANPIVPPYAPLPHSSDGVLYASPDPITAGERGCVHGPARGSHVFCLVPDQVQFTRDAAQTLSIAITQRINCPAAL